MVVYHAIPPIPGCQRWPEWYRAGDDGSIWSRRKVGRYGGIGAWRRLKPSADRSGILKVSLMPDHPVGRNARVVSVAVCVCRAFHGPRPLGCVPLHYPDPDRADCRADNLRWAPRGSSVVAIDHRAHQSEARAEANRQRGAAMAQLTDDQVLACRRAAATGKTSRELADELGVGRWVVDLAIRGRTYRHLPGALPERATRARGINAGNARLDDGAVRDMRARAAAGEPAQSLATRYGVALSTVYQILRRRTWKHVD